MDRRTLIIALLHSAKENQNDAEILLLSQMLAELPHTLLDEATGCEYENVKVYIGRILSYQYGFDMDGGNTERYIKQLQFEIDGTCDLFDCCDVRRFEVDSKLSAMTLNETFFSDNTLFEVWVQDNEIVKITTIE
ncbi:hypothetical protein LJB89_00495 [Tyzzerella sp. OttesenSCG-928-J15]|nr:hypothetical protein [Tyzzerella sp. OttesenSCG-928-J15]